MSKKCRAYSINRVGLETPNNRKAFYSGWEAAMSQHKELKMTKDDVIQLAQEAGLSVGTNISAITLVGAPSEHGLAHITIEELERFAALVAAVEREACAAICEAQDGAWTETVWNDACHTCAAAIRKRTVVQS